MTEGMTLGLCALCTIVGLSVGFIAGFASCDFVTTQEDINDNSEEEF